MQQKNIIALLLTLTVNTSYSMKPCLPGTAESSNNSNSKRSYKDSDSTDSADNKRKTSDKDSDSTDNNEDSDSTDIPDNTDSELEKDDSETKKNDSTLKKVIASLKKTIARVKKKNSKLKADNSELKKVADSKSQQKESTNMLEAIENGNWEKYGKALKNGADINATNNKNVPAIICAISKIEENSRDRKRILDDLLANPNLIIDYRDADQKTALHLAALTIPTCYTDSFEKLVKKMGSAISSEDARGNTALHYVAFLEKMTFLKILLANGANANAQNRFNTNPLHIAALQGYLKAVQELYEHGAMINTKGGCETRWQCEYELFGNDSTKKGSHTESTDSTPLHAATARSKRQIIDFLLAHFVDTSALNGSGKTAVALAKGKTVARRNKKYKGPTDVSRVLRYETSRAIEKLLSNSCPSPFVKTKFEELTRVKEINGIKNLNEQIIKKSPNNTRLAAYSKKQETAENFADIKSINPKYSLSVADYPINKYLASIYPAYFYRTKDEYDNTPLHYAAFFGTPSLTEKILNKKVNVNARNKFGTTPLQMAVIRGDKKIIELLLKYGADQEILSGCEKATTCIREFGEKDKEIKIASTLSTALHAAVRSGNPEIVELLLQYTNNPANITTKNGNGKTIFDLAEQRYYSLLRKIKEWRKLTRKETFEYIKKTPPDDYMVLSYKKAEKICDLLGKKHPQFQPLKTGKNLIYMADNPTNKKTGRYPGHKQVSKRLYEYTRRHR